MRAPMCRFKHALSIAALCPLIADVLVCASLVPSSVLSSSDHTYSSVCRDLHNAREKVKVGGLIVMNDYYFFESAFLFTRGRWGVYGVIHAVNEFLIRHTNFEVAYYAFHPKNEGDIGLRRVF